MWKIIPLYLGAWAGIPKEPDLDAYLAKYRTAIGNIDMTPETFSAAYNVLLRVIPTRLRGM